MNGMDADKKTRADDSAIAASPLIVNYFCDSFISSVFFFASGFGTIFGPQQSGPQQPESFFPKIFAKNPFFSVIPNSKHQLFKFFLNYLFLFPVGTWITDRLKHNKTQKRIVIYHLQAANASRRKLLKREYQSVSV
jgi:hypothetical protein